MVHHIPTNLGVLLVLFRECVEMKIHLLSDLHAEFSDYPYKAPEGTDVIVAAGDIHKGLESIRSLRRWFGDTIPILFVPGNHEYYKGCFTELNEQFKFEAFKHNVVWLYNQIYTLNDVNFMGATFWSDYELYGNKQLAQTIVKDAINDFKLISYRKKPWERFTPTKTEREHHLSKSFIIDSLHEWREKHSYDKKAVVVTHMAPHPKSVHERWGTTPMNAYYASDQTVIIEHYKPDLWLHGHTHDSFDYIVDKTRVVCNPRGYSNPKNPFDQENTKFNKDLLIEI